MQERPPLGVETVCATSRRSAPVAYADAGMRASFQGASTANQHAAAAQASSSTSIAGSAEQKTRWRAVLELLPRNDGRSPSREPVHGIYRARARASGRRAEVDEASQQWSHLDPPAARNRVPARTRCHTDGDPRGALDALPKSRTREFVRGLLIEHGVLPRRDLNHARYDEWSRDALDRLTDPVNREVIRRFIRWQHQRHLNQMDQVPQGTFLRSKQTVTVAIDFLNWLTGHGSSSENLNRSTLMPGKSPGHPPG